MRSARKEHILSTIPTHQASAARVLLRLPFGLVSFMSESPHKSRAAQPAITDSPWFWVAIFSAAGVMFLVAFSPKYAARQRRLEMQYYARQEITRRQVEGSGPAHGPGQEAAPPAPGELIIPLWPLVAL